MNESMVAKGEKRGTQKPPLSVGRIAGEILAGTATAFAIELLVVCVVLFANKEKFDSCFGGLVAGGIILCGFPVTYGPASAVGVYLVGSRGKQTGSFLATLACGVLGGFALLSGFRFRLLSPIRIIGIEQAVLWAFVLFTAPVLATLGFNLTREYKEPPSS